MSGARGATPRKYERREISPESHARLVKLIATRGCDRAADLLGSSPPTIQSAVARLPMTLGTLERLEKALLELESAER